MRKLSMLAASVALALSGLAANADININFTRTPGTGGTAAFDIVRFFAQIPVGDPSAGSAPNSNNVPVSGLQSIDLTMQVTDSSGFAFRFQGDPAGYGDIVTDYSNVANAKASNATTLGNLGTGMRVSGTDFFTVGIDPHPTAAAYQVDPNDPNAFVRTAPRPEDVYGLSGVPADDDPNYSNSFNKTLASTTKSFRVKGSNVDNPDASAITNTTTPGTGALFAVAVVPHGANIHLFSTADGGIAGKTGPIQPVDFTTAVPEPGSIMVLALGGMGLLARRRRQTV